MSGGRNDSQHSGVDLFSQVDRLQRRGLIRPKTGIIAQLRNQPRARSAGSLIQNLPLTQRRCDKCVWHALPFLNLVRCPDHNIF
jgi:hypothetical protein